MLTIYTTIGTICLILVLIVWIVIMINLSLASLKGKSEISLDIPNTLTGKKITLISLETPVNAGDLFGYGVICGCVLIASAMAWPVTVPSTILYVWYKYKESEKDKDDDGPSIGSAV